jgi:protein TonB
MSDNNVEKKFLYLILLSLLVHAAIFMLLLSLPEGKKTPAPEPLIVDLEGVQLGRKSAELTPPVKRHSTERQRVEREVAPKGEDMREKRSPLPPSPSVPAAKPAGPVQAPAAPPRSEPKATAAPEQLQKERSPRDELFRKKAGAQSPDMAAIYPDASRMAKIEESLRKKYGPEVAEGEASFLNTDDIRFGSFLRRFETAVYAVWRYPAEAARMGIEGITPVKITFNRRGEIVNVEVLRSSGSNILDNEVLRALKQVGPVGSFPKGYDKETFNLIAFFHYGIVQGTTRSLR